MSVNVATVALLALLTALATGLGAIPFLLVRSMSRRWLGLSNAVAAGVMLAASMGLILEGVDESAARTAVGILGGLVLVALVRRMLRRHPHSHLGVLRGVDARRALFLIAVMTAHSFAEGIGVGVAFGGGEALGVFITIAIALHNIPEGLAISLVLVPQGARVRTAAVWSIFTSLPQPLIAVPAFLFVEAFRSALPTGLGLAAGAMTWMVVSELFPAARADARPAPAGVALAASFGVMFGLQAFVLRI